MPLINYHSVLTLNSWLSSELLSLGLFVKETLALLRHYIENQKIISETIITDTVKRASKELLKDCVLQSQEKYSTYQQFSIFVNDNTILNIFSS